MIKEPHTIAIPLYCPTGTHYCDGSTIYRRKSACPFSCPQMRLNNMAGGLRVENPQPATRTE